MIFTQQSRMTNDKLTIRLECSKTVKYDACFKECHKNELSNVC